LGDFWIGIFLNSEVPQISGYFPYLSLSFFEKMVWATFSKTHLVPLCNGYQPLLYPTPGVFQLKLFAGKIPLFNF
jgi:hypothetical protein